MMERVTTITAKQFIDQDYDDIVFDNQAVVTFGDLKVIDITPRTDEFVMLWVYSERIGFDKVKVPKGEVLVVRWLDTTQTERDAEAFAEFEAGFEAASDPGTVNVYPGVDKQGYDILSGGKLDRWKHDKGDAFEYALVLANDKIRALQAERDELARKLAAAVKPLVKVWTAYKFWTQTTNEDFVDYMYLIPNFEELFEKVISAAAALKGE